MRELSLHILDIAQNSLRAGASEMTLLVEEQTATDRLIIEITDNGCGMTREQAENALNPFYTSRDTRKVGLGLPLYKLAAEMTGGGVSIASTPGEGTVVTAEFGLSHIDRMPLGDMAGCVADLMCRNENVDIAFVYRRDERELRTETAQFRAVLDGVPMSQPEVTVFITEFLREQIDALTGEQ